MFRALRSRLSATSRNARPRQYVAITRLGFHFIFVAAFAMVGGALRGFNLLLILAGILVGAVIMQWRYSRWMTNGITVHRRLPAETVAGVPFRIRYRVRNRSRFKSAWMFWIEDRLGKGYPKRTRTDQIVAKCAVGQAPPRSTVFSHVDCVITRRGRYRFESIAIASTFPFSLLTCRSVVEKTESLFVFPRLVQLRQDWQSCLLSRNDGVLAGSKNSGMSDGEFFGLREWQSGDNPRWIHWRTSARVNELAVRQFEQHRRFDLCLLLDGYDPAGPTESPADGENDAELAISLAATMVVRLNAQPSNRVALAVAGTRAWVSESDDATRSPRKMLQRLAETQTTHTPRLNEVAEALRRHIRPTRDLVVISTRSFQDAMNDNPSLTDHLGPWVSFGKLRWLDLRQPEISRWFSREHDPSSGEGVLT